MNNRTHRTERWFTYTATNMTRDTMYLTKMIIKLHKITCFTDCNKFVQKIKYCGLEVNCRWSILITLFYEKNTRSGNGMVSTFTVIM